MNDSNFCPLLVMLRVTEWGYFYSLQTSHRKFSKCGSVYILCEVFLGGVVCLFLYKMHPNISIAENECILKFIKLTFKPCLCYLLFSCDIVSNIVLLTPYTTNSYTVTELFKVYFLYLSKECCFCCNTSFISLTRHFLPRNPRIFSNLAQYV